MSRSKSRFSLERIFPEQRVFLRSEQGTRFIRLRPRTQLAAFAGGAVVLGWAIFATSALTIDAIGAGPARDQAQRAGVAFEQRLTDLAAERDTRAIEAATTQERFNAALAQVSQMQSQLLASEQRRHELETGLALAQNTLNATLDERDQARKLASTLQEAAETPEILRTEEYSLALGIISDELANTSESLTTASTEAERAREEALALTVERDAIVARNDAILTQLEDAMVMTTEPLDKMFRSVGINPDDILTTVRRGYSGTGGPLTPMGYSTRGDAAISETEARATQVMISLDQVNSYRIAVDKVPLAMPVKAAFRYSSGFGPRWGRMHQGVDLAGPVGTPIFSTAEGTVTFAGWQRGYGNVIKVQHALGIETRYSHLSKIHVKQGQKVSRGARIGDMGNTGRSTGSHLHYEVRVNGAAVDPMKFIKAAQNVF